MSKTLIIFGILFNLLLFKPMNPADDMPNYDYVKAWKQVTEYEQKELPQSALNTVNEIYMAAKEENNTGQFIKAVIHQLKFIDYKEGNAFIKNLDKLKAEAEAASFPAKPILHSMLGEMYWQYYQNNRYTFLNRTETSNFEEDDIQTWSLPKIVRETLTQYDLSLQSSEKSKEEDISEFSEIYYSGNELGFAYQPTLFDFLTM